MKRLTLRTDTSLAAEMVLVRHPLCRQFSDDDRQRLARCMERIAFEDGEVILTEGQQSASMYLVESGEVLVTKGDGGVSFVLSTERGDAVLGDMSYLDERPVSATVTARGPTVLFELSRRALLADHGQPNLELLVARGLACINVARTRSGNDQLLAISQQKLAEEKLRTQAAQFLILVIVIFGIQNFASVGIKALSANTDSGFFEWGMLLIYLMPSLLLARRFGNSWQDLGLTLRGAGPAIRDSLILVPLLVVGGIGFRYLLMRTGSLPADGPLVVNNVLREKPWELLLYAGHSLLQELGSRGIFQGNLQRFFGQDHKAKSVLVISVMFAILHLHLGLAFSAIVFVGSLFFGSLYARHGTLVGVSILHYFVGMTMQFLGFM
jgi:CRP-like cAMP-binding protein